MSETVRRLRFRAARTPLRAPFAWWRHRDIKPDDVFLASFERSGSTWLRFLLCELLTGDSAAFERINSVIPEMGRQAGIRGFPAPVAGLPFRLQTGTFGAGRAEERGRFIGHGEGRQRRNPTTAVIV